MRGDSKVGSQHLGTCLFHRRMVHFSALREAGGPTGITLVHFLWLQCLGGPTLAIQLYCFRHNCKLASSEALRTHCLCSLCILGLGEFCCSQAEPVVLANPGQECNLNGKPPSTYVPDSNGAELLWRFQKVQSLFCGEMTVPRPTLVQWQKGGSMAATSD